MNSRSNDGLYDDLPELPASDFTADVHPVPKASQSQRSTKSETPQAQQ